MRAFDAGWGGAVWKTIGEPVTNVSSRYSATDWHGQRMMGFNNIELISDRSIEINLREMAEVKKRYPQHAVIASLMVESKREAWHDIVARAEDAGADGLELNFGCPHGMSERGMGSAVGQVPEYAQMITEWVKEKARTPVLVKLTPNITDIRAVARAAKRGGADGLSAINTINSITGIDLDTLHAAAQRRRQELAWRLLRPGREAHRAQHGAADHGRSRIRAAALRHRRHRQPGATPAEFILLGCGTVQVCTAVMHYGYRIVEDMAEGLDNWMRTKGFRTHRRLSRPLRRPRHRVEAPQPELQNRRAHRRAEVHRLRPLPHRLLGWRASVHSSRPRLRPGEWPRRSCMRLRRRRRRAAAHRLPTHPSRARNAPPRRVRRVRIPRRSRAFRAWTRPSASAAISARCVCPVDDCITMVRSIPASPETWERTHAASADPCQSDQ